MTKHKKVPYNSHYDYLEDHLKSIFEKVGINWEWNGGIISAHGDKAYGYEDIWKKAGIEFPHGVAIYLMTYCKPYSEEVRQTKDGFINPGQWVVDNYDRFKEHLPPNEHDPEFTFFWRDGRREIIRTLDPKSIFNQDPDDEENLNFYVPGKYCYDYYWDVKKQKWIEI